QLHHRGGIVQEPSSHEARQRLDPVAGDLALAHHDRGALEHRTGGGHLCGVHGVVGAGDHHDGVLAAVGDGDDPQARRPPGPAHPGEPHPGRAQAGQAHLGLGVGADGADHLDAAAELRGGDGLVGALAAGGHAPAAAVEGLPRPRMAHHVGAEVDVDRADHRDRTGGAHSNSPALSSVTVTTSTETSASTSPSASTLAASATACLPSSAGCWAMVASSVPAATAAMPSSVPSKPTTVTSVPARSPSASIAPSAISSFSQKMPTTSGLACSRLVATFRPSARSKFAVCWATTVMSENCSMPSVKPWPRSREAEEPGTPCSTITSPSSPIAAARASAAWVPPATLSEAMKLASSPEVASRSTAMTGMSASLSDSTEVETASESVGLTITRAWPWVMALASWLAWVA